jgi:hypothetical protein
VTKESQLPSVEQLIKNAQEGVIDDSTLALFDIELEEDVEEEEDEQLDESARTPARLVENPGASVTRGGL